MTKHQHVRGKVYIHSNVRFSTFKVTKEVMVWMQLEPLSEAQQPQVLFEDTGRVLRPPQRSTWA